MMKEISRREFMAHGARITGAVVGVMTLGTGMPLARVGEAAEIQFPQSSYGINKTKGPKFLVAYASRCGSTGGVAEAIGQSLCHNGAIVDVRLINGVTDLTSYEAVIVGSAIRSDQWLPEATAFVENNRQLLSGIPVAYFLTCLTMSRPSKKNQGKAGSYLKPVITDVPEVKPVDIGLFAGALDYGKLPFHIRMVMKLKMSSNGVSEGDYRDWEAIRHWVEGLRPKFLARTGLG
ncbi:MAG: flavodoxin [Proteobacteria bacterium]|nr:flavodoxin [Pseudomonadota bacterium]